ncbi:MAG: tetratricopeptide repeat protein [Phenylobacterium sp.]|uniref:tetratricopeptide repeat protein n=1 Tax=Phenylobacterium sp. TaxID=1871053 RepID=UPI002721FE92|nr:tetratricopeptide repeat protein [Phenylobacterium sp.]MDO8411052.1 tetratricopeptide repeat protein [Phenylobacterium sp.]
MSLTDRRGLPISTTSDLAADRYREGVDLMFAGWPSADAALDQAIAADPDFALAHAARARLDAMSARPREARTRIAHAAQLVATRGTERERSHVDVLALLLNGEPGAALEGTLAHVDSWPQDALILSLPLGAFGLFAFSGMANHDQARVDLCNRHATHYGADDWWFLTSRGWAEVENGDVPLGRAMLQTAFELHSANAHTVHGWAHALFEAGAGDEGEALIRGWLPGYDRTGILHGHLAWHAALIALERSDLENAMALYALHVHPSVSASLPINVVSDAASLLWRAEAYGHEPSRENWSWIADYAAKAFPKPGHAFIDVHMALIEAAMGDRVAVDRRAAALTAMVEAGRLGAGQVVPAICRAALAFAEADYPRCVAILEPLVPEVVRIGGSGAQREIVEDTLLVALMRSGETAKARDLLDRRLHRRPSPRDTRWRADLSRAVA